MTITKRRTHIKDEIYCEINFPQCPAFAGAERLCIGFRAPVAMHVARQLDEVVGVLRALEAASQRGHWCVGFIAHEAAAAFDAALVTQAVGDIPLVWFAEFSTGETLPAIDVTQGTFQLGRWQSDTSSDAFHTAVESIRADIANGRFYQVNFTTRLHAHFSGDALAFYRALEVAQPDGYHVYIDAGEFQLLSVSPELFFSMQAVGGQTTVIAQPMKGTAPRGDTAKLD
ncbi:MAG: chorismate-binding protein, partial [Pseudomonadota bacterium]